MKVYLKTDLFLKNYLQNEFLSEESSTTLETYEERLQKAFKTLKSIILNKKEIHLDFLVHLVSSVFFYLIIQAFNPDAHNVKSPDYDVVHQPGTFKH